ncbi:unnamed protein product [Amaranthus hypochondriacus]
MALKAKKKTNFITKPDAPVHVNTSHVIEYQEAGDHNDHTTPIKIGEIVSKVDPSKNTETPLSSDEHSTGNALSVPNLISEAANSEPTVQSLALATVAFNIGPNSDNGKKRPAIKRRAGTNPKTKGNNPNTVSEGNVGSKGETGKRKQGDDDVDMEDADTDGKRSRQVSIVPSDFSIQVAEVGIDQPREKQ